MMGIHQSQSELFNYSVNLDQRVRADHPLRRVAQAVDFSFVRDEVAHCYGDNGNESVDPVILLKMSDFPHSLSLQPTPVGRLSSAFAVDITHPAWLRNQTDSRIVG
jgi:hypothetical protein